MLAILLTQALAASPDSFFPGPSSAEIRIEADGTIEGTPVELTGVVLAATADPDALEALPQIASVHVKPRGSVVRIVPAPGVDPVALSRLLHDRADVRWAHPDLRMAIVPHYLPDDPMLVDQWHLRNSGQGGRTPGADINAEEAWDLTAGAGQLIAIIDTGIDPLHPDLDAINGFDYVDVDDDSTPVGDDAHGTACAGLAAGMGDNGAGITGVAYDAQTYGIRLIGYTSLDDMYDAFVESVDAGASVLSNSWGFDDGCSTIPAYGVIEDAMTYAEEQGRGGRGAVVVFSAGNGNCDITNDGLQAVETVVSVAASTGDDVKAGYSSFGPWVDISAPSDGIVTADITGPRGYNGAGNDYTDTFGGTSASAPEIAGVFALMFAVNDRLSAAEAREAMCATAVRIDLLDGQWDDAGWSPIYGCGRVDAGAAVRAVANQGPPEVPVPTGPDDTWEGPGALLTWTEAADPDGDAVEYKIRWWYADQENPKENAVDSTRPWLELTEEEAQFGWRIAWRVRAVDRFGPSEWSADQLFEVVKPAEPEEDEGAKGCDATGGSGAGVLGLLGLLGIRRR